MEAAVNYCGTDVERERTCSTEAFISHLKDEDISKKNWARFLCFCFLFLFNEANWLVLLS